MALGSKLTIRSVWTGMSNFWSTVLGDHRTYYVSLEFITVLILILGLVPYPHFYQESNLAMQRFVEPLLLLLGIMPIHWYSNQRNSNHALTKARSHLLILASLTVTILVCQLVAFFSPTECVHPRWGRCDDEIKRNINLLLRLALAILAASICVVCYVARNPIKDPFLAELPPPIDIEDEATFAWAAATWQMGLEMIRQ